MALHRMRQFRPSLKKMAEKEKTGVSQESMKSKPIIRRSTQTPNEVAAIALKIVVLRLLIESRKQMHHCWDGRSDRGAAWCGEPSRTESLHIRRRWLTANSHPWAAVTLGTSVPDGCNCGFRVSRSSERKNYFVTILYWNYYLSHPVEWHHVRRDGNYENKIWIDWIFEDVGRIE